MSSSTNYAVLLSLLYPGAEWSLSNSFDFNTLEWGPNNSVPKPSHADLLASFESQKTQEAMRLLRAKRDELLRDSDAYALPDFPHPDEATKQAWLAYRQALRDLTTTAAPQLSLSMQLVEGSVTWPSKPASPS